MCPGTEFGIIDTVAGAVFCFIAVLVTAAFPWSFFAIILWISTIGWFGMAIYCFRFASTCKCQQYEAEFKATMDRIDALLQKGK